MPGGWKQRGLGLRPCRAEEIYRFVMGVCETDRHYQMSDAHIESWNNEPGYMELFKSYFSAFLYLGLVFAILTVFKFYCGTNSSGFKFYFGSENPFGIELIGESQNEAGN